MEQIKKWWTVLTIVDINTGLIVTKKDVERGEYLIHKKEEPQYKVETYLQYGYYGKEMKKGYKYITWQVIQTPQNKLEL